MSDVLLNLHRLLPESKFIRTRFELTVDAVNLALCKSGLETPMIRIPGFDTDDWDDQSLARLVFDKHSHFHSGAVFIHAPACYRHDLDDFITPSGRLMNFISEYRMGMLFDGDVIFLAPESATLTLFHHEGAYSHIRLA